MQVASFVKMLRSASCRGLVINQARFNVQPECGGQHGNGVNINALVKSKYLRNVLRALFGMQPAGQPRARCRSPDSRAGRKTGTRDDGYRAEQRKKTCYSTSTNEDEFGGHEGGWRQRSEGATKLSSFD